MPLLQKYEIYGVRHAYIEYNNAGTLAFKRAYFTNKCDIKIVNGKLEFSGDGQKISKNYGYQANGTLEFDIEDNTIDSILYATPAVGPQGGDLFATRYVKGTDAEMQSNFVGLRVTLDGADHDTGAPIVVLYRIPKVQFQPDNPVPFASEAKAGRMLAWDARKTTTDVTGAALTGIPSRGCFWFKDFITNLANFDPIPNDND